MYTLPDTAELSVACAAMPLFPLPGAVFLPHTLLPLHVFEERYKALISDILEGDGYLSVPRLQPGWEADYSGSPPVFTVAGIGKVIRCQMLPDGRSNVVILGLGRIRLGGEIPSDTAYRIVKGQLLSDVLPSGGLQALRGESNRLRVMLGQALANQPQVAERVAHLIEHQTEATPFINGVAHLILPDVDARQDFLKLDAISERIDMLLDLLANAMFDEEMRV